MFDFARQRAYLHLFIALACGCAVGYHHPLPVALLRSEVPLLGIILVLLTALWFNLRRLPNAWALAPGYALLAAVGVLVTSVATGLPLTAPLNAHAGAKSVVIEGRVISIPKFQRGHLRFMLQADEVVTRNDERIPAGGLCYVYVKAEAAPELYYREQIRLRTDLKEIEPPLNQGQFDYRRYLLQRGTVLTAYSASPAYLERLDDTPPRLWAGLAHLRGWLTASLARGLPPDLGELAVSVVYGDKITDLPEATEERFRRAGLTHILVASGTQISLLIVLLAMLCWRFTDDFSWRGWLLNTTHFAVTLAVVAAYAAITGFETSIIRALVMGGLVMAGRLLHRQADGLTALAQSGLILLLLNPLALMSPGFQLSFGATFGLIYTAGVGFPLIAHLTGWRRWAAQTLVTTGGAQLFVAPVLAAHFQQLSVWGLFSNMLAIPLAFGLLVSGGALSLGLAYIPVLGDIVRLLVHVNAWLLDRVAWLFAALPGSNLAVPHPPWWWLAVFYAVVFLTGEWVKARDRLAAPTAYKLRLAVPALALALYGGVLWWLAVPHPGLTAFSLNKCEAYLWRPYTGRNILLLASRNLERSHNADTVASALRYRGINRLDGIIVIDAADDRDNSQSQPCELIPDYPAPLLHPGEPLPTGCDLAWIRAGRSGVRGHLGSAEVWVAWGPVELSPESEVDTLVMYAANAGRLHADQAGELAAHRAQIIAVGDVKQTPPAGVVSVAGEFNVRPQPAVWWMPVGLWSRDRGGVDWSGSD